MMLLLEKLKGTFPVLFLKVALKRETSKTARSKVQYFQQSKMVRQLVTKKPSKDRESRAGGMWKKQELLSSFGVAAAGADFRLHLGRFCRGW